LEGNIYILDTNKLAGSSKEGTMSLETAVAKGDTILWSTYGLEVESYVRICNISVDETYISKPKKEKYKGTNIEYWTSDVLKNPPEKIPYNIRFEIGNQSTFYTTESNSPSIKPTLNSKKS
jgi:hypothetical protein